MTAQQEKAIREEIDRRETDGSLGDHSQSESEQLTELDYYSTVRKPGQDHDSDQDQFDLRPDGRPW